ncbi:hypothetical protein BANRA_05398 [Klebsiella pneumoniae]|uniref:hypothetical protein n=1 Tax=Klebsiella pneumoniae TaxID=573 RepID=UPI000F1D57E8|nr:hypothetical protein [Klebsiella pneumoniae]VDA18510.1 hypothetical protein BANRA_05398 [Klebsiella pneumoniae]
MSIKQETCRRLGLPCDGVAITHLTAGQLATALRAFKACEALTERGARGIDAALIEVMAEAIAGITGAEPACCRAGGRGRLRLDLRVEEVITEVRLEFSRHRKGPRTITHSPRFETAACGGA